MSTAIRKGTGPGRWPGRSEKGPGGISASLFGSARRGVLSLLFGHADEAFYLRQIARATGLGLGAVQRELSRLTAAGILRRTVRGHQVYFQANEQSPVFAELKSLVVKTAGMGEVLRSALMPLGDKVSLAFIYGSIAAGGERQGSDVDLVVVGNATFEEVTDALAVAQKLLSREINPTVYSRREFSSKWRAGHHFLASVMAGPKIFVAGDEFELARMGPERLAHRPSKRRRGNPKPARSGRSRPSSE